jgi:hypothetical protein
LQPKSEMKENSPDRADALIGAICLSPVGADPYATRPNAKKEHFQAIDTAVDRMIKARSMFHTPYVDWNRVL